MRSTSNILAKTSLILSHSQLAVFDKNSWFIVAAGSAGGLDCIMSNSIIVAISSGTGFFAEQGGGNNVLLRVISRLTSSKFL